MRFVLSGEVQDVSTAVHAFFVTVIGPKVDSHALAPPNAARREFYTEEVDAALRRHEGSLREIYTSLCGPGPRTQCTARCVPRTAHH